MPKNGFLTTWTDIRLSARETRNRCGRFFYAHTVAILFVIFIASMAAVAWHLTNFSSRLIRNSSLQDLNLYSEALTEVRTLYTDVVVERIRSKGIPITHDYLSKEGAIPLPATFSMELARRIGQKKGGMKARLYSKYPFPWRRETGGPKDKFEQEALDYLQRFPDQSFHRFENYEGGLALRFATADRMRPNCVVCHNTHPDSPRRSWKVGDVRGILEVIRPLDALVAQSRVELRTTFFLFGTLGMTTLLGLILVFMRLRNMTVELEALVEERTAQALQSAKLAAVGQLAAGIAHEINNPLGIILGFAQSAVKRTKENDVLAMPLKSIEREAMRCKNLVQSLLAFSRRSGREKKQFDRFDFNETILNTLSIIETQAKLKSVEIAKELGPLEAFRGDINQLQQVLTNLCNNAIDAMPNGGKIMVRTSAAKGGRGIILEIEDNGSGIPAGIRDKIFNPFFTTKEIGKGTGLGLSLVFEIVQGHGGTIEVRSAVGSGTTFVIFFPTPRPA